jgi:hypothetical protein
MKVGLYFQLDETRGAGQGPPLFSKGTAILSRYGKGQHRAA